ncbi:MAG: benzoate-CoA ligase family protein [Gemmatimonadales bacterium]
MRASDLPLYYNAADILERNLAERSDKIALYSDGRSVTFGEISREVNRVGNALKKLDVRMGECVGILAPDSIEWVSCFFGVLKIGAVALGMNTLLKPHDFRFMLEDARVRVLFIHRDLLGAIEPILPELVHLEHIVVIGSQMGGSYRRYDELIAGESPALDCAKTHREDFGTLNYSSGTTGTPKGIFHSHKDYALTAELWGLGVLGLRTDDRTFSNAKLFFVYGLGGNLLFPWYVGANAVLHPGSARDAARVLRVIDEFKPTVVLNAPTGYAAALAVPGLADEYDLSSVRLCVSAGEALPPSIWHEWKEKTGITIIDGIGSTENFHVFISNRPDEVRPGSSGKPVPGYEVRIVDDDGAPVTIGQVGNLMVKGETAATGYLHEYERSRQTFQGEWLHTGDKYYQDADGFFWHAGRSDDMLKVGGIWVSPVEVESALISHPNVLECAVTGVRDRSDLVKPKAWVVLTRGIEPSENLAQALIAHCTQEIAAFKRPRWVQFVDELPKTATGKIQRFKLRQLGDGGADVPS